MSANVSKRTNWAWLHRFGSPKWFYGFAGRCLPWLAWGAAILLTTGLVWGVVFTSTESIQGQGDAFRIIYLHVPAAFIAQSCYLLMAIAALVSLVWRIKLADIMLQQAAPLGAWLCFVALASGSLWGKPTWGTYWVWDARLTSMLILLFLYLGIIALGQAFSDRTSAGKATAVLTLVGVVNLPIIKYSVDVWNTLHQKATFTITARPQMQPEYWLPLLLAVLGMYCLFAALLIYRARTELLRREHRASWVQAEIARLSSART